MGRLEVYYGGLPYTMVYRSVSTTYFDNIWVYMLLQRTSGTVTLYVAMPTDTSATNCFSFTYHNPIDNQIDFGCSENENESYTGFMDGIEVGFDRSLPNPTVIPTSAPT